MTIPLQFVSLCDGQEIFVWSNYLLNLGTDLIFSDMVFCKTCLVPCGSTSFLWLIFFFADLLRRYMIDMIHKYTGRWMWHLSYFGTEINTFAIPYWFQPCHSYCRLCYPGEYQAGSLDTWSLWLSQASCTLIPALMPLVLFVISLVSSALISMP